MLKTKTKTTKSSKLPIPRRNQPVAVSEVLKPVKEAKQAMKPAKAARPATVTAEAPDTPPPVEVAPEAAQEPQLAAVQATVVAAAPQPAANPRAAGKLSCLDAAAEVLKATGTPMRCREMVAAMKERGLWSSDAPTPNQTLVSALLREVTKKGAAARFRKAGRGQFELATG